MEHLPKDNRLELSKMWCRFVHHTNLELRENAEGSLTSTMVGVFPWETENISHLGFPPVTLQHHIRNFRNGEQRDIKRHKNKLVWTLEFSIVPLGIGAGE